MKVTSDDDYDTVFSALKSQRVLDETGRIIPEPEDIEVVRAEHPARSEEALLQLARAEGFLDSLPHWARIGGSGSAESPAPKRRWVVIRYRKVTLPPRRGGLP